MKVIVKLTEAIALTFDNATAENTAAGTLIVKNDAGDEVGMYPAGTYLSYETEE